MKLIASARAALLAVLMAGGAASAERISGTEFTIQDVGDEFGRRVTFYSDAHRDRPLALIVQGSGCTPHFRRTAEGRVRSGLPVLLTSAARGRVSVLAVEKPGAIPFAAGPIHGTTEGCPPEFLEEHTLERWVAALRAAIDAALRDGNHPERPLLAIGHSEGAAAVARLARLDARVSHVAMLSGNGPSPLDDLIASARRRAANAELAAEAAMRIETQAAAIFADPDSIERLAWGHPFRRWSSFLRGSTLVDLRGSTAEIHLAHGSADAVVPLDGFEALVAGLAESGHRARTLRVAGGDHSLNAPGQVSPAGLLATLAAVVTWATGS